MLKFIKSAWWLLGGLGSEYALVRDIGCNLTFELGWRLHLQSLDLRSRKIRETIPVREQGQKNDDCGFRYTRLSFQYCSASIIILQLLSRYPDVCMSAISHIL